MKAAIYTRVSTQGQVGAREAGDKVSLADQEARCRAYCERQGWEVAEVYREEAVSGAKHPRVRPQMKRLLVAAAEGKLSAVVAYSQDRLGRDTEHTLWLSKTLRGGEVDLATVERGVINRESPADKLTLGMFALVGEYEREVIRERMDRGISWRLREGTFAKKREPFGYRWSDEEKRPMLCEEEAEIVRLAYSLATEEHLSAHAIAKELNRRKLLSRGREVNGKADPTTRHFTGPRVRRMLSRPQYKGEWLLWRGDEDHPEPVYAADPPRAVVTAEVWAKAQKVLAFHKRQRSKPRKHEFLLAGLCTCGVCGNGLTVRVSQKWRYYCCNRANRDAAVARCPSGYVPADELEAKVLEAVGDLIADRETVDTYLDETRRKQIPRLKADLEETRKALEAIPTKLELVKVAYQAGADTLEEYAEHKRDIAEQKTYLEEKATALEGSIAEREAEREQIEDLAAVCKQVRRKWARMDTGARQGVLRRLGTRVTVWPDGEEHDPVSNRTFKRYRARVSWGALSIPAGGEELDTKTGVCYALDKNLTGPVYGEQVYGYEDAGGHW